MGFSTFPAPVAASGAESDNWTLISSVTPTAGATTVTFSSIASHKKLMLRLNNFTTSIGNFSVTFNGDTGAKYSIYGLGMGSSSLTTPYQATNATNLLLGSALNAGQGVLTIEEADTASIKNIWGYMKAGNPGGNVVYPSFLGSYVASAAISSITLTTVATFNAVGTIQVWGVS
jgi:hypothetical protein